MRQHHLLTASTPQCSLYSFSSYFTLCTPRFHKPRAVFKLPEDNARLNNLDYNSNSVWTTSEAFYATSRSDSSLCEKFDELWCSELASVWSSVEGVLPDTFEWSSWSLRIRSCSSRFTFRHLARRFLNQTYEEGSKQISFVLRGCQRKD